MYVHGLVAQTDPDVSVPFCRTEGMSEDASLDKNKGSLKRPRLRWSAILASKSKKLRNTRRMSRIAAASSGPDTRAERPVCNHTLVGFTELLPTGMEDTRTMRNY